MSVVIREKQSGAVLAEAGEALKYEGYLYFGPESVKGDVLKVTERTYTCPYKGVCHWVDFTGPDGRTAANVAWVYQDPKPGHEAIKGQYGFYPGDSRSTRQEG